MESQPSIGPPLPGAAGAGSSACAALTSCCARAQALAAAGADPPCCSEGAPRRKGIYDMATGRLFPHRTGRAHIVDRRTLGAELVAEAERLHPRAITFHFDATAPGRCQQGARHAEQEPQPCRVSGHPVSARPQVNALHALRQPATRDLSVFWRARVALQLTGALWLVRPRCSQAVPGSSTAACTPSGMSRAM